MNKRSVIVLSLIALLLVVVAFLAGRCSHSPAEDAQAGAAAAVAADEAPTTWTCSMHPQILQPDPGDCPICGMDLIPLTEEDGDDLGPRAMSMSESAMALADIQTRTVQRAFPVAGISLVGRLDYDETRIRSLTARFPARIEELFVNFTGIPVQKGDHLAIIYSPELLTAQRELLTAYQADPDSSITRAAREKLLLWDLLPSQIDAILERGAASDTFELKAPMSGIVIEKNVNEGSYIQTGQPLFKIVDLGKLWLFLDAYESDLPWLRYGQGVDFSVEAWPGESFTGTVAFIEPEVDRRTRTVSIRVNVPNEDRRLKPGMFARGTVEALVAEGGKVYEPDLAGMWISPMHPEIIKDHPGQCDVCGMDLVPAESLGFVTEPAGEAPLVVPASAVLRTGKRAVVYLKLPGREKPAFEGREIVLGPRAGDVFLVKEGLSAGDEVVTHGAFKIDSALQIQAKPSMMNPPEDSDVVTPSLQIDTSAAASLIPGYFALQDALAADDLEAAREALMAMMEETGHVGPLPDLIHEMLAAASLDDMRRPHFEILSNAFIEAVRADPAAFDGPIYLMHCPMVYADRDPAGADWLQDDDKLLNPYFGAMMLRCGEVREQLK